MPTLYIHMGTPKTATTSIQMFFVENQERFREKGYSYPLLDFVYPHVAHRRNGHFLVGRVYHPDKTVKESFDVACGTDTFGVQIPKGEWHNLEVLEPDTVILEVKDGPYMPLQPEDTLD